jgi:PAS domain-containing protein
MMNAIPFGISITDHEGTIVRKNARYDAITAGNQVIRVGVKPWEICKGWFKRSDPPLQPQDWPAMQAITTGKPVLSVKIHVQRLDGSFGTILESAAPIMDVWGRVSGARVITQDITS